MQIVSLPFAAFVLMGLVLFHARPGVAWRRGVLLLLNLAFLSTFAGSLRGLAPMLVFLGFSLLAIHLVNRYKSRGLFALCLFAMLLGFFYLKRYEFLGFLRPLGFSYVTAGLAYMIFRVLHLLIDTYQAGERRRDLNPLNFFNYVASFLTFTAGPVQRFEDHLRQEEQWREPISLTAADVRTAFGRLADGLLKLALLGPWVLDAHHGFAARIGQHELAFMGAALAYLLYIYLNFSGYMGVMIGIGGLFGMRIPENFDSPFLAANFLDLWNRWHITVSQWFKTYVFNDLLRFLCSRWSRPALMPYFGVLAYFCVFFLLGVWHDWGNCFLVLGFLLGLGASVNKLWEVECKRRLGRQRHQALTKHTGYRMWARSLALTWFVMSAVAAWEHASLSELMHLLRRVGAGGLLLNFAACVLLCMAVETVVRGALAIFSHLRARTPSLPEVFAFQLGLSARVLVLLIFLWPGRPALSGKDAGSTAASPARIQSTTVFYGGQQ